MRMRRTFCMFPLVAPLFQSSLRERDQNQVVPVSNVRRKLSSLIHATMSTSPVPSCCTTAGISPFASSLSVTSVSDTDSMHTSFPIWKQCTKRNRRQSGTLKLGITVPFSEWHSYTWFKCATRSPGERECLETPCIPSPGEWKRSQNGTHSRQAPRRPHLPERPPQSARACQRRPMR